MFQALDQRTAQGRSLYHIGSNCYVRYLTANPDDGAGSLGWDPLGRPCLPYVPAYCKRLFGGKLLAVGDEEGVVTVVNTDQALQGTLSDLRANAQWVAHQNAIFDLQWLLGDDKIVTAAGDKTIGLWDTSTAHLISSLTGHQGSVRTISGGQCSSSILASGGRDGSVMIWDARCSDLSHVHGDQIRLKPVNVLKEIHNPTGASMRKRRPSNRTPLMDSCTSVTSVLLLAQDTIVASAGAANQNVHLWDMRKLTAPSSILQPQQPIKSSECKLETLAAYQEASDRDHGIVCMSADPSGSRLLVSSHSAVHYMYNVLSPHCLPIQSYSGHQAESFYVRTSFSPDGSHFVSGSSDGNAYVWEVAGRGDQPLILEAHKGEVSGTAWCRTDACELATCGDDFSVKIWKVNRNAKPLQVKAAKSGLFTPLHQGTGNIFSDDKENLTECTTLTSGVSSVDTRMPLAPVHQNPLQMQGKQTTSLDRVMLTSKPLRQRSMLSFLTPKTREDSSVQQCMAIANPTPCGNALPGCSALCTEQAVAIDTNAKQESKAMQPSGLPQSNAVASCSHTGQDTAQDQIADTSHERSAVKPNRLLRMWASHSPKLVGPASRAASTPHFRSPLGMAKRRQVKVESSDNRKAKKACQGLTMSARGKENQSQDRKLEDRGTSTDISPTKPLQESNKMR